MASKQSEFLHTSENGEDQPTEATKPETRLTKASAEYKRAITFIYSANFQYFESTLTEEQKRVINLLRSYPKETSRMRGFLTSISTDSKEADRLDNIFYRVLLKIYSYLCFLDEKHELLHKDSDTFNLQTAPYFWDEINKSAREKYTAVSENSLEIKEYISLRNLNSITNNSNIPLNSVLIYYLHTKGYSMKDIGAAFKVHETAIQKKLKKLNDELFLDRERNIQFVIDYLSLRPHERTVFFLALRDNLTFREIAQYIDIKLKTTSVILNKLRSIHNEGDITVQDDERFYFDAEFLYPNEVNETYRKYIPQKLNIETEDIEELVIDYCMDSSSKYKEGIFKLFQAKQLGLIRLYFLFREVPNIDVAASLTRYSINRISNRIFDIKKALLPKDDPAFKVIGYDWVEIFSEGRKFLLSEDELKMLEMIEQLDKTNDSFSIGNIARKMSWKRGTTLYRLRKVRAIFDIDQSIPTNALPQIVGIELEERLES